MKPNKQQIISIILLALIIPLGFYSKLYSGIGSDWVNNKLGGVFYEIFWCLVFFIIFTKSKPIHVAVGVLVVTSLLEFVQLLNNAFLEVIRSNFIGQTIIGNSFAWSDFPYYVAGALVGYLILKKVSRFKSG
ncbi:MAG: DUF2809 domain-containing protein [Bacteroidetes bacterium]|nr:DUF2809 domain-containing protein [Bacteroidota bacterium]